MQNGIFEDPRSSLAATGELSSPKRQPNDATGNTAWYGYYAGFSPTFVRDVLRLISLEQGSIVTDPWNGAGTTTEVAHDLGYSALGYDLSPPMVIVGKARLLGLHTEPSHAALCTHILKKASSYRSLVLDPDPLSQWLTPRSTLFVRNIERALQHLLVDDGDYLTIAKRGEFGRVSSLAAFFYVALFRTVRQLLTSFRTTNPTWLKVPSRNSARLRPSSTTIRTLFREHVAAMAARLHLRTNPPNSGQRIEITVADSRSLPLPANSVDAVIGSPPYCTRIDYAVAARPELAVLGYDDEAVREMREQMIGTATISKVTAKAKLEWGPACNAFLESVRTHNSHASESYYWKNHVQYFDGLYCSLQEIHRILRPGHRCVLVVQDSYYKEIHNDLPTYVIEIAGQLGLSLWRRHDFRVEHTFAGLHPHRKTYRSHATALESVLSFARQ